MELRKAKRLIRLAIRQNGPYSHNIVGLVLSSVARDYSIDHANSLIDEFDLEVRYSIRKIKRK